METFLQEDTRQLYFLKYQKIYFRITKKYILESLRNVFKITKKYQRNDHEGTFLQEDTRHLYWGGIS